MAFPQSFMDELVARSDIVDIVGSYVPLTAKGGSYWGCCPCAADCQGRELLGLLPLPQ